MSAYLEYMKYMYDQSNEAQIQVKIIAICKWSCSYVKCMPSIKDLSLIRTEKMAVFDWQES